MAGVAAATHLAKHGVRVTVIDRNDYLQFQPLLYQVATSQLPAEDVARPLQTLFADSPTVTVVQAEVTGADLQRRVVHTSQGDIGPADHLVVAAGSTANFFGTPGAAEHSFPLYSVVDAERLRRQLSGELRRVCLPAGAEQTAASRSADEAAAADPADRPVASQDQTTVVIVGGGPTGVETAGAVGELVDALVREGRLAGSAKVQLVDHGHALLKPFTQESQQYALAKLQKIGVDVEFGLAVTGVQADGVTLSDGSTRPAHTVVWGGGVSAPPVVANLGAPTGHGGRIDVAADLSVPGFPGVWAIGDVANIPDTHDQERAAGADSPPGHPPTLPQLGSVAVQSGEAVAHNIRAVLKGKGTEPFAYRDKGIMAMIGRNAAVAEVGRHRHEIHGPVAFIAWLGLHAMLLSGVHSRVDAFLQWANGYVHKDRAARLELDGQPDRIAWDDDSADRPTIDA
ncbi:NAD(P)/FAD-dependent oxidoreductase [Nakamurella flava]|uniref:NAD(P)/FAD-dependent oxidoreductase n=2 Tax=Nakamurella flava TaxID=2576308 RepID=A0A4U6QL49_9ACTN|nr:NAD(P)/FAD-dependent oxidoreductase [Nakamurella flava]